MNEKPDKFINDRMQLSPMNYERRVTEHLNLAPRLVLCDATIREGAQGSIIGFSPEEKYEILKRSADAGARLFQIGVSTRLDEVADLQQRIENANLAVETEVLGWFFPVENDIWKEGIDRTLDSGATTIDLLTMLTPYASVLYGGASWDEVIDTLGRQVDYIVSKGGRVSFDPMDGPRTDADILVKAYRTAVDTGAQRIRLLDTVGTCGMAAWRYLVTLLRHEFSDVALGVHCHNDYGQAMANVYTSIECGADIVDVCINGLGERSGNAALAEVAAGAEILYGMDTGITLEKMFSLSEFVGDVAGHPPERNKPIVGKWAFAHGDEAHVMMNRLAPWIFEGVHADVFGNEEKILVGTMSGPVTTRAKLAALGFDSVEDAVVEKIFADIKQETMIRRTVLTDDAIRRIAGRHIG